MVGSFPACCAPAVSGHEAADPAINLMKSRRRIAAPKAQSLCGLCFRTTQLQQGFPPGGMRFDRHFAWQQSSGPNVRFGSKADIAAPPTNVCFTPKSRTSELSLEIRFVPTADILRCGKERRYSITSSARCLSWRGTSMPIAFAVLRLITSSNLTGAWTGSSLGFAPLRTRSA